MESQPLPGYLSLPPVSLIVFHGKYLRLKDRIGSFLLQSAFPPYTMNEFSDRLTYVYGIK